MGPLVGNALYSRLRVATQTKDLAHRTRCSNLRTLTAEALGVPAPIIESGGFASSIKRIVKDLEDIWVSVVPSDIVDALVRAVQSIATIAGVASADHIVPVMVLVAVHAVIPRPWLALAIVQEVGSPTLPAYAQYCCITFEAAISYLQGEEMGRLAKGAESRRRVMTS
eukprot:c2293_g1_i2.p3 GENE.c2293_g1_i2~~c2293_g1_i2.p3  ORF type:complete len:168 (+),score=32.25 c2293_g1_i2:3-506(+)